MIKSTCFLISLTYNCFQLFFKKILELTIIRDVLLVKYTQTGNYLHQDRYVIVSVCWSVCMYVSSIIQRSSAIDNNHQVFLAADPSLGSMCLGSAEPRSWPALASADECLKFCDDTPSATTLPTLNNPQDLHPYCSVASFLLPWTQAHWNAIKQQCGVNGVQALLEHEVVKQNWRWLSMQRVVLLNFVWTKLVSLSNLAQFWVLTIYAN